MRLVTLFLGLLTLVSSSSLYDKSANQVQILPSLIDISNQCISFSVSQGTGCAWMCNYCATQLGTPNYYFTDNVCTYEQGGCVGNPLSGKTYTCCSL
jgi:hypothetical protein